MPRVLDATFDRGVKLAFDTDRDELLKIAARTRRPEMTKMRDPVAGQEDFDWKSLALNVSRDGFVVVPGALREEDLRDFRAIADATALTDRADYPGADQDVGYLPNDDQKVMPLMNSPPLLTLLELLLGPRPLFINAWMRVALPHSVGGVWHQDLEREFWPAAVNVALYLDDVTLDNGPTLVVPGTHTLPHPEFDARSQPRQCAILGRAGTVALMYPTTWHRGSANRTDRPRRALFVYYRSRDAIRVRRSPDPAPGEGWVLGDAGPPHPHWSVDEAS